MSGENLNLKRRILKELYDFKNHPLNKKDGPMFINLLALKIGADVTIVRSACADLEQVLVVQFVGNDYVRLIDNRDYEELNDDDELTPLRAAL